MSRFGSIVSDSRAGGSGTLILVVGETPIGAVNGANATFTTAFEFTPASVELFINGIRQIKTTHFTTSGTTTVLVSDAPSSGDQLQVNYERI